MSIDAATVRRIAHLARIRLEDSEVEPFQAELNNILGWVEQLGEVNTDNVEPMTSVENNVLFQREDAVTDGGYQDKVLANAPHAEFGFFGVPKVIE